MKTHQIVCKQTGENSTTAKDPICTLESFTGDLTEKTTCCLNSGDDRLVTVDLYEVREVSLPDWMSPEEWIGGIVSWKYTFGMGAQESWPKEWLRGICRMSTDKKLACIKLLKTKAFRSEFRKSLHAQLVAWLETPSEDRKYSDPFSSKQWGALIDRYTALEAKHMSERLYWAR